MYKGMTCASGSPAFKDLIAKDDSFVAQQLRAAGAVCLGLTNTPPMMASGMHRGYYGRAESPYNLEYLTAAFSSGSSNGSGTSTAASFAAFSLGSETVSSGRSPASNNALVAYTPSRTVISPRGCWPLYPTCDVLVPHTRTVEDMLTILDVLTAPDADQAGEFWREQTYVKVPEVSRPRSHLDLKAGAQNALCGKRIAIPKMYIGGKDPEAKPTIVSEEVVSLWRRARKDLESLGATVTESDFPLVTNYESGPGNNVQGFKPDWNAKERGELVAYMWDDFLKANGDPNCASLVDVDGTKMFPNRPDGYLPDLHMEVKNFMNYPRLVELAKQRGGKSIWDLDGIAEALPALEAQRKRDLEDWMEVNGYDLVVFPANGDVGKADLETNEKSAEDALQNGVKYSNGNRAIRHMGVPTVSVTMGLMDDKKMPVNLTFAGKHGQDSDLLRYAYAFEQQTKRRVAPPLTPALKSDDIALDEKKEPITDRAVSPKVTLMSYKVPGEKIKVELSAVGSSLEAWVNGKPMSGMLKKQDNSTFWTLEADFVPFEPPKPPYGGYGEHVGKVMVTLLVRGYSGIVGGKMLLIDPEA